MLPLKLSYESLKRLYSFLGPYINSRGAVAGGSLSPGRVRRGCGGEGEEEEGEGERGRIGGGGARERARE